MDSIMDNNVVVGWQVQQTWTVAVVREFKRPYYWEWATRLAIVVSWQRDNTRQERMAWELCLS